MRQTTDRRAIRLPHTFVSWSLGQEGSCWLGWAILGPGHLTPSSEAQNSIPGPHHHNLEPSSTSAAHLSDRPPLSIKSTVVTVTTAVLKSLRPDCLQAEQRASWSRGGLSCTSLRQRTLSSRPILRERVACIDESQFGV